MQILVISGFLGAGKTRFIKKLVQKTGRFFAIVENEFASVNVDSQTLKQSLSNTDSNEHTNPNLKIWELTEGCICCSTNLDFTSSVLTIANTVQPDYLIVEPSGVAHPSRIIQKLSKICYEKISLLAPITVVDAEHYVQSRKKYPAYFNDQLKTAARVILSKSESLSAKDINMIERDLKLSPDCQFMHQHYDEWSSDLFNLCLNQTYDPEYLDRIKYDKVRTNIRDGVKSIKRFQMKQMNAQETEWMTWSKQDVHLDSPDQLYACLKILAKGGCGHVIRAKGYIEYPIKSDKDQIVSSFLHFELVEGTFTITGIDEAEKLSMVVIGEHLMTERLSKLFSK